MSDICCLINCLTYALSLKNATPWVSDLPRSIGHAAAAPAAPDRHLSCLATAWTWYALLQVGYRASKEVFGHTWDMEICAGEGGPVFKVHRCDAGIAQPARGIPLSSFLLG